MPLQKLQFRPGLNREGTDYSNEGGWYDADKVRFRSVFLKRLVAGPAWFMLSFWGWLGLYGIGLR
jgi:hypothetical protein